jgi:hypothetical protein
MTQSNKPSSNTSIHSISNPKIPNPNNQYRSFIDILPSISSLMFLGIMPILAQLSCIREDRKCLFDATKSVSILSLKSTVPANKICSNLLTSLLLRLKHSISKMNIQEQPPQAKHALPLVLGRSLQSPLKLNQLKIVIFYRQN